MPQENDFQSLGDMNILNLFFFFPPKIHSEVTFLFFLKSDFSGIEPLLQEIFFFSFWYLFLNLQE